MDIKILEKATKLNQQVKDIDQDIKELDKLGVLVARGDVEYGCVLAINDLRKKKENEEKEKEQDQEMAEAHDLHDLVKALRRQSQQQDAITDFRLLLSEASFLKMVAIALDDLYARRKDLIDKLKKLGVEA